MAAIWFGLAGYLKRAQAPRTQKVLDNMALVLSIACAAAMLLSLDCQGVIQVTFFDSVCRSQDLHLAQWGGI